MCKKRVVFGVVFVAVIIYYVAVFIRSNEILYMIVSENCQRTMQMYYIIVISVRFKNPTIKYGKRREKVNECPVFQNAVIQR